MSEHAPHELGNLSTLLLQYDFDQPELMRVLQERFRPLQSAVDGPGTVVDGGLIA